MNAYRLLVLCSLAILPVTHPARADYSARASCSAGNPSGRDTGLGTYWTSGGAASATIAWSRDATNLDDTNLTGGPFRSVQFKFDVDSSGNPVGRTLAPLNTIIGTGRFGSTTSHTATGGSGQSAVFPYLYAAHWTCAATSNLGTPPAGSTAKAYGYTTGADPWYLLPTDITRFSGGGPSFDLRIPFSMDAGTSVDGGGSVAYDVSYETAGGTTDLLRISGSALGVSVWTNPAVSLSLQSIASVDADPNIPGVPLSITALTSALQADLADGRLDLSRAFALSLNGLPIPSGLIPGSPGAAAVHVDSTAYCAAESPATPTPGTATLLLVGSAFAARRRRR